MGRCRDCPALRHRCRWRLHSFCKQLKWCPSRSQYLPARRGRLPLSWACLLTYRSTSSLSPTTSFSCRYSIGRCVRLIVNLQVSGFIHRVHPGRGAMGCTLRSISGSVLEQGADASSMCNSLHTDLTHCNASLSDDSLDSIPDASVPETLNTVMIHLQSFLLRLSEQKSRQISALSLMGLEVGGPAPSALSIFRTFDPMSSRRLPITACLHPATTGDVSRLPGA